jgi:threonine/homoserine/homoserine lactone efflux protein
MDISSLARGLLAGYGVAIPLGPITLLIVEMGIQYGFRTAICGAAGAAAADLIYATAAVFVGVFIAHLLAPLATPLHYLSAAALILIGVWLLDKQRTQRRNKVSDPLVGKLGSLTSGQAFTMILGLTLLNPLTITYFTALILSLRTSGSDTAPHEWLFIAGVFLASFSWQMLVAGTGSVLRRRVSQRVRNITQIVGGLLVISLGIAILAGLY